MHQRNRKEPKAFYNILPWHPRKKGIHPQEKIKRSMGARDKREGATRGRQQNVGRRGKISVSERWIITSFHTSLKSQMRKEIRSSL